uniref:hypothetical protein n=1 Tax=Streptomyces sp. NBC_01175 TaxID=2903759 RepID=UPI002F90E7A1|nr:hypothetical protein OG491_36225 [Streptomyces sp. NBC_01175]
MTKPGDGDPGKKSGRRRGAGIADVGSGLGRPKGDKSRSPTSPAAPKNLFEFKSEMRRAAPVRNSSLAIRADNAKATMTKGRARRNNAAGVLLGATKSRRVARLEEALAHHSRPITTVEARRMNKIIKADRPAPELRPRRR